MPTRFPSVNEIFANRYRLLGELGEGGMGVVFRAHDEKTDQTVALKVVRSDLTDDNHILERFHREIKILRRLDHPNIVKIHDDGIHDEFLYFTMEIATGPNLGSYVDPVDRISLELVLSLFGQICSAINHAHSQGVIHRDLKPTNIIIQDSKIVKLLDFGLARLESDAALTLPGQALGTAAYMAPEVGRGEEASPAADIYALGCLFYQLAVGELPYKAETPIDIIVAHQKDEIPSLRAHRPEITNEMEKAVQKAMSKSPDKRYESALQFFAELTKTVSDSSPSAPGVDSESDDLSSAISAFEVNCQWRLNNDLSIPGAGVLGGWIVAPSPDMEWLAVGADCIEGPLLYHIREHAWSSMGDHGAGRNVRDISWSRSGRLMTFVNASRLVLVDMTNNQCVARLDVSNHRPWSVIIIPTPTGKPKPVVCGESGGAVVWEKWPDQLPQVFRAHTKVARTIELYPGGGFFVSGGLDGTLRFWRSRSLKPINAIRIRNAAIWNITFSRSGQYLAAASSDQENPVVLFSLINKRIIRQEVEFTGRALSIVISQSERLMAVGCHQKICFLEPDDNGVWRMTEAASVDGEVRSVAFGQADRTLYAVTSRGRLLMLKRGTSQSSENMLDKSSSPKVDMVTPV
jgi:serine/threonine protein kinase